ncbi:BTAD domain-containing putative transcriptional regulator [Wukongibacter baidiensis]|uniref:AfsR/SARP family transcriptional regulator n=1 Tax=Wukongibacter baidiensis TaxID=1723361 RepID=UPI003D7F3926
MRKLSIKTFGVPTIQFDDKCMNDFLSQKAIGLLIYLGLNRNRLLSRERLASYFWELNDLKSARYNLRHTIWKINRLEDQMKIITTKKDVCSISEEFEVYVDAIDLESCSSNLTTLELKEIERVLQVYSDDFMDGEYYPHASVINEWIMNQRQYYQKMYFEMTTYVGDIFLNQRDFDTSLKYYKNLLLINPLHEDTYLKLMENRLLANNRVEAISYYMQCQSALRNELNIDPNQDIQNKYLSIISNDSTQPDDKLSNFEKKQNLNHHATHIIKIRGQSFIEYELVSRLIEQLIHYIDLNVIPVKDRKNLLLLRPIYPEIDEHIVIENENKLSVKQDIGIYYGLMSLFQAIRNSQSVKVIIEGHSDADTSSKDLINAVNMQMNLEDNGILILK